VETLGVVQKLIGNLGMDLNLLKERRIKRKIYKIWLNRKE
jgi:hypothetical protein